MCANKVDNDWGETPPKATTRRVYKSPKLEQFGPISYLTQGSMGDEDDAGSKKQADM